MNRTDGFIAYLSELLENQIIHDQELLRFIQGLEKGEILNPISNESALLTLGATIHHEGIQKHIEGQSLEQHRLLEWAQKKLAERNRTQVAREETRWVTQDPYHKMEFHPVPAGSFRMGEGENCVKVILTHPFEIMSTLVTQKMWADLMGGNSVVYAPNPIDPTLLITVNGKQIKMSPDHPVEVNWWSTLEYANRLSIQAGLKPTYDLTGMKFKPWSSAEAGDLEPEEGQKTRVKINAPNHNIYLAEGYRLPTEAEAEYVMKAAGKANDLYYFGNDEAALKDYAWYKGNSLDRTHAVAELKPLTMNGKNFYDLYGNLSEWIQDWYAPQLKGGRDPQGPKTGYERVTRGGSWYDDASNVHSSDRLYSVEPWYAGGGTGFRLVRTIRSDH